MSGDDQLARAAARGDAAAFTGLVQRHEASVRNLLDRLCGGVGAGDDLAQDTFIRAWRLAGSYRGNGAYRAWLLRIAWRVFLSDRGRRPVEEPFDPDVHGGIYEGQQSLAIDLDRALASLGTRDLAIAVLCFGEGCSHQEAARITGLPLGTVKSMAARARKHLIAHLESGNE